MAKDKQNNLYALTIGSTYGTGLFKSTNNGESWIQVWNYEGGLNDLYIDNDDNIYIGLNFFGEKGGVYKSSNRGESWTNIFPFQANAYCIIKTRNQNLLVASQDGSVAKIFRTSNEWLNWESYSFSINFASSAFAISSSGVVFLATYGYGIYRSTDNGQSWNLISQTTGPDYSCLLIDGNNIYAGNRGYWVYRSTNSGDSFSLLNDGMGQDKYVLSLGASKNGYLYAGMDYYGIYRSSNKVVSAKKESDIAREFVLKQNYPNPFNPKTNVEFVLAARAFVEIKILNIIGKEILTLINEEKEKGVHNLSIDMSDCSSGVYCLSLKAFDENGRIFSSVRKMILLK